MSRSFVLTACPRQELLLSSPRTIEEMTTYCYCCRKDGIICAGNENGGRIITSKNGIGPVSVQHPEKIEECWQNLENDSDDAYKCLAHSLLNALKKYIEHQDAQIPPTTDCGEKRGPDSEQAVAEILFNPNLLPWIVALDPQAHNSEADKNGTDLTIRVSSEIAQLLRSNTIQVQIKSNPKFLELYLKKLADKRQVSTENVVRIIVSECFVFLNGGAGAVTEAGVFVPFVAQLFQLIYLRSGSIAAEQFLQILHPTLIQKCISLCANGVLWRDYKFLNVDGCIALLIEKLTGERMLDTGPTLSSKPQSDRTSNIQPKVIFASQPKPTNGNGKQGRNGNQRKPASNRAHPTSLNRR